MPTIQGPNFADRDRKTYLGVTVESGGVERNIRIKPPTKRMFDAVQSIARLVDEGEESDVAEMYDAVAAVMSNNREGVPVTEADLEAMGWDIQDMGEFVGAYVFFLEELAKGKN